MLVAGVAAADDPFARLIPEQPVKGDSATPPSGPGFAPDATGGPDGFGYVYIDSDEAGGPTAGLFFDISGTGTAVPLGDDAEVSIPLGMDFPFYGTIFTSVFVVSNGHLSFDGGTSGTFTNECPIAGTALGNMIAPYWDDLDPGDDGASAFHEYFAACPVGAGECTIVQWEEFDFFPGDGAPGGTAGSFQVVLYGTGDILFQYEAGGNLDGASATIAINQDGAANSLQYGCDSVGQVAGDDAILFSTPPAGDLAITKTGEPALGGSFAYVIDVVNNGPEDQTGVVVTDTIPAELVFVSDDCGGSFDGTDWTWNIGSMVNGATATCEVIVELVDNGTCVAVSNTATVSGDLADPSSNNSSTAANGGGAGAVADPSFELGTPNAEWAEFSTNFGTPICDVGSCGTGTGTGPFDGNFWTWFGGIAAVENGSMTQDIVISSGVTDMTFWLETIVCDSAADFMEVTIDGTQVYFVDGSSPLCGNLGYTQQTADISAFADGGTHTLAFNSSIFGANGNGTNFFVDLVDVPSSPSCDGDVNGGGGGDIIIEVPTLDQVGLAILAMLLVAGAAVTLRRRRFDS
jgi:uncharacterized repeat protein (TIGR01451 family)